MGFIGSGYEMDWPMFGNRYTLLERAETRPEPSLASPGDPRDLSPSRKPAKSARCPKTPKTR